MKMKHCVVFKLITGILLLAILVLNLPYSNVFAATTAVSNDNNASIASAPTAGLVAYYPFDGDLSDRSGNNNHGTGKGNMSFASGKVGQAASFDGQSWIEVGDSDSLDLINSFTFALWVYKEDNGRGGYSVILSKGDTNALDNNSPYCLAHTYDGLYPLIRLTKKNAYADLSFTTRAPDFKRWYHLAVTWDGRTAKLYLDGVAKDSRNWEGPLPSSTSKLLIGCDPPGWIEYFRGLMDEVRIYNVALSPGDIAGLAGITLPATPTSPAPKPTTPSTSPTLSPTQIPAPPLSPSINPSPLPKPSPVPSTAPTTVTAPISSGLIFESRSKAGGGTIQIPITLRGAKEKIGNMDLTLNYDPAVLKASEAFKGSLTTDALFDFNITTVGTIKISLASKAGFEGDGSVAYIVFSIIGAAGTICPLRITNATANRASDMATVRLATQNGTFKVLGSEQLRGDFDGDGKLTALDALAALQMAVGKRAEDLVMDVTDDGKVTSADARKILQMAVSSITVTTTPVPSIPKPASTEIPEVKMSMVPDKMVLTFPGETAKATATPAKGAVIQKDAAKLVVPPGAVAKDTAVEVKKFTDIGEMTPPSRPNLPWVLALSDIYDFGPAGVTFSEPVEVTFSYDESLIPAYYSEANITICYHNGVDWIAVPSSVDTVNNTASIRTKGFPGMPLLIVLSPLGESIAYVALPVIILICGKLVAKPALQWLVKDPLYYGKAPQYVTPNDPVVKERVQSAIVTVGNTEVPLSDLGKVYQNLQKLEGKIVFKIANETQQVEYLSWDTWGNDWIMPNVYFTDKNPLGKPLRGDCKNTTNAYLSMLRNMGLEAYGVDGYLQGGGRRHTWVEFVIADKVFYVGENGDVKLLTEAEKNPGLVRPKNETGEGFMWNEQGQYRYKEKWWEQVIEAVPTTTPATPPGGQEITATGSFTNLDFLGWKPDINTVSLTFNSAGGPVTGSARLYRKTASYELDYNFVFYGRYRADLNSFEDSYVKMIMVEKSASNTNSMTKNYNWYGSWKDFNVIGSVDWPGSFKLQTKVSREQVK